MKEPPAVSTRQGIGLSFVISLVVQVIVASVIVQARGHDLAYTDPAFDLHFLHLLMDQFLYIQGIPDIFQSNGRLRLVVISRMR